MSLLKIMQAKADFKRAGYSPHDLIIVDIDAGTAHSQWHYAKKTQL